MTAALPDLTEDQLLDRAGVLAETVWRAEVELLEVAGQWAVVHSPERLDPQRSADAQASPAALPCVPGDAWE